MRWLNEVNLRGWEGGGVGWGDDVLNSLCHLSPAAAAVFFQPTFSSPQSSFCLCINLSALIRRKNYCDHVDVFSFMEENQDR